MSQPATQRMQFNGQGGEYFRIWIINVVFSVLTLGVYSAWAKVRRTQYFYRNTTLAGFAFDYHGDPKIILKGRIIAVILFGAYSLTSQVDPLVGLISLIALMAVMPWLLMRSLRFRFHNTSYRGLRFAFDGSLSGAYVNFLAWPLLAGLTLGILWPVAQQRITAYVRGNARFGGTPFRFEAGIGRFYAIYAMALLIALLMFIAVAASALIVLSGHSDLVAAADTATTVGFVAVAGTYFGLFLIGYPYVSSRLQNLNWANTRLDDHGFTSDARARELLGVTVGNWLLTILTLGLYKPFADIRMARYRLQRIQLIPGGSLDAFFAGLNSDANATGDEVADIFDFDIAL